jgi:hypothetical protein
MLKHMVFSQKKAARKKKCMHMAETKEKKNSFIRFKIGKSNIQHSPVTPKDIKLSQVSLKNKFQVTYR